MNAIDAFGILGAIIASLVAYIFMTFRSDTAARFKASDDRFSHTETLIEQMVLNNNKMSEMIKIFDYRIGRLEGKPPSVTINNQPNG